MAKTRKYSTKSLLWKVLYLYKRRKSRDPVPVEEEPEE